MILIITGIVAIVAGAIASVAGFGIGSLLTPLLALYMGTKLAVAAVSIPHFIATAWRCWMLRRSIDRRVLLNFGIASAIGGLLGALAHTFISNVGLTAIFGAILVFAGLVGITGLNEKVHLHGAGATIAGALSGGLGGLVGNQGGIRSAALLAFDLPKDVFVATGTATGVIVDLARMPVYIFSEHSALVSVWQPILASIVGVLIGTYLGIAFLRNVPEKSFKRIVSSIILLLGVWMITVALGSH